ncbi:MAG: tripartite tricarboxylate transporter substrate binding protein [Chloroflexota bacterium]
MKRISGSLVALAAVVSLTMVACSAATPAPTPTKAPAAAPAATSAPAAPKAADPTKAPEAPKVAFPEKGKAITMIVPFAAGGSTDVQARLMAPALEKEFGTPVQVANKAGAGSQVGITELTKAKPDGYTIGTTNMPSTLTTYMDPERKATYGRKDMQAVANVAVDPSVVAVAANGPYKTLKDLVDAAKAKPGQVKSGTAGIMSSQHVQSVMFAKATGVEFAHVHFDGGGPALTALLGGHIDVTMSQVGETLPQVKSGNIRILAVMDAEQSKFLPEVKTLEAQGYKVYADSSRGVSVPAGTPKEIVQLYSAALKKVANSDEFKKKMEDQGIAIRYMDTPEYEAYWTSYEEKIKPLLPDLKK